MSVSNVVFIVIALTMLGGCTASEPARQTAESDEACVWVMTGMTLKIIDPADGIDPSVMEQMVGQSLERVNERCDGIGGLTPLQGVVGILDDRELPMVFYLLMQGADINLPFAPEPGRSNNRWANRHLGGTALHIAAAGEGTPRAAILEMLVDFGGDMAARTDSGAIPLHFAAADGDLAMVEVLVERGSDVNARDERGWTPLHYSASEGSIADVVVALMDLGADPEITTNLGLTAHDLILENPDLKGSEAARLLEVR